MRTVVSRVHHESIVGDTKLVEIVEHLAHVLVVIDHRVVVGRLPAASLTQALGLRVGVQMHVGEVEPQEERLVRIVLALDEVLGCSSELIVTGFHALLVSGPVSSIFCLPTLPQRGCFSRVVLVCGQECSTPRGPNFFLEIREVLFGG